MDALIGAFWASRFNQDLRRHPLPFSGGFRAWASRSRRDPLAALSLAYDPYWRTLRQVVAQMAGVAPTDLPAGHADPGGAARDRGPDPGPRWPREVRQMPSLRDTIRGLPDARPIGSREPAGAASRVAEPQNPLVGLEEAALAVLRPPYAPERPSARS